MRCAVLLFALIAVGCASTPEQAATSPAPSVGSSPDPKGRKAFEDEANKPIDPNATAGESELLKAHQDSAKALSGGMKGVDTVLGGR